MKEKYPGVPIVNQKWIFACLSQGKKLPVDHFLI